MSSEAKTNPASPAPDKLKDKAGSAKKPAAEKKVKESKSAKPEIVPAEEKPLGPAASGPSGTGITKVLEKRLTPPGEKELKSLPTPKEDEAFSVLLHPGYLEKAEYNTFSVDRDSDDFKELYRSIESMGVREPVIATPGENGMLQIVSGQRRHLIATELNYPVPTIIQKLDPEDARILVADSNLHREKISSYDLSRALRMKADSMKKKAGRRRKDDRSVKTLDTSEELAKEMGMNTMKLNRLMKLSEATKDVCDLVDEGTIPISIAYNIAFLSADAQDSVAHLVDLGYKLSNDNTNMLKTVSKNEALDEQKIRDVLDGLYPPKPEIKQELPPLPAEEAPLPSPSPSMAEPSPAHEPLPPLPEAAVSISPPVPAVEKAPESAPLPASAKSDPFVGGQEKPYVTKIILTGDRLRKYFPDVSMTPREIEESVYDALEERRQRQEKMKQKAEILKGKKDAER